MRNSAYIAACVGALLGLCAASDSAWAAGKKYRVLIESQPEGAKVWVDEREGEPLGTTPYKGRLTAGNHTLFLELDGHEISVEEITVKKRRRGRQSFKFELVEVRVGSIDVLAEDGAEDTEGAKVYLDGEEVGTVPDSFDAPEGPHQVEVFKEGFERFESWVEVKNGESQEVTVALAPLDQKGGGKLDLGDGTDKGDDGGMLLRFDAGMGAGWRRFDYNNPNANGLGSENLLPYSANGLTMVNLGAELFLGGISSSLSAFSIFGSASLTLPVDSVTADGTAVATSWFRREVGARARLAAGPGHLGFDLAEGGSAFTFDEVAAQAAGVAQGIATAEYEYVRVGAWYGIDSDGIGAGLGGSFIAALSVGGVADRFNGATVLGPGGNAWFRMHLFAGIEGAITASMMYLTYAMDPVATYDADGGYDLTFDVFGRLGYSF